MTTTGEIFKKKLKLLRLRRKIRARKIPRIIPPKKIEIEYYKKIKSIAQILEKITDKILIQELPRIVEQYQQDIHIDSQKVFCKTRLDTYSEFIKTTFETLRFETSLAIPEKEIIKTSSKTASSINTYQKNQFNRTLQTVIGAQPTLTEKWLEPKIESFIERNVSLIKSIPEEYFQKLEITIRQGIEAGKTVAELKEEIKKTIKNKTFDRAQLIARDQTNKFFGDLNELRQKEVGVEKYIWRTSGELNVRGRPDGVYPNATPSHWAREGKVFYWNDPPEGGHPGFDFLCNCTAEPVLDEFIQ